MSTTAPLKVTRDAAPGCEIKQKTQRRDALKRAPTGKGEEAEAD